MLNWKDITKELSTESEKIILCTVDKDGIQSSTLCSVEHIVETDTGNPNTEPASNHWEIYDIGNDEVLDYIIIDESSPEGHYFEDGLTGKWVYASELEATMKPDYDGVMRELEEMVFFGEISKQIQRISMRNYHETGTHPIQYIDEHGLKNAIKSFRPIHQFILAHIEKEPSELLSDVMDEFNGNCNPNRVMESIQRLKASYCSMDDEKCLLEIEPTNKD